jgi:hypothetical protein
MTSLIINIFEDNFFGQCMDSSFLDIKCIIGSSYLILSLIICLLNIIALYKLSHFYKKINFETNLILFSIFQIIILQIVVITAYELLIEFFNFFQIFVVTLIIRKFIIISKQNSNPLKKNGLFILLNTVNILFFGFYIMFLFKNNKDDCYSIILTYILFYILASIVLIIYSKTLLNLIMKIRNKEIKSTSQSIKESSNEKLNELISIPNDDILTNNSDDINQECIFYSMRKKQIKPLYTINIICSFLEFSLIFSLIIIPSNNLEQTQFKIIPNSIKDIIIFYLYLFICLFNVSENYICFFWIIRNEFSTNYARNGKNSQDRILDNKDIKRETISMKKEEPVQEQINYFIENNLKNDPKKIEKSIYISSFEDISETQNNISDIKNSKELENNMNEKDNGVDLNNKELFEPLNSNNIDRESIPSNMESIYGINRLTIYSSS